MNHYWNYLVKACVGLLATLLNCHRPVMPLHHTKQLAYHMHSYVSKHLCNTLSQYTIYHYAVFIHSVRHLSDRIQATCSI